MTCSKQLNKKALIFAAPAALVCASSLALADMTATFPDLHSQVTLYGFLNAQVESVRAEGGTTPYRSRGRVSDGNSRLGFSGSTDINATTQGIWQLEGSLNNFEQGGVSDQGTSATLESRNSFVGIQDQRFGRAIIGHNDSAYRSLVGSGGELGGNLGLTSRGLDLWNNTSAQMSGNTNSIFGRGESRYKNSVHYFSPQWYGLEFAGSYGFDEALANGGKRDRYSLALKYTLGRFEAGVGYDHQMNTGVDVSKLLQGFGFLSDAQNDVNTYFYKGIVSYKFPTGTYFGGGYEVGNFGYFQFIPPSLSNFYPITRTGTMKQSSAMVSVSQEIGPDLSIMMSYGRLGNASNAIFGAGADYSSRQYSVGAIYNLNKTFSSYIFYTDIKNGSLQSTNLGESPIFSNAIGTPAAYLSPGDRPRAFGIGFIARF